MDICYCEGSGGLSEEIPLCVVFDRYPYHLAINLVNTWKEIVNAGMTLVHRKLVIVY